MIANVLLKIAFVSTISLADGTVDKPQTVVTATGEPQVMIEMRLVQINVSDSSAVPVISDLPAAGKTAEPKATPRGGSGETVGTGRQGTRRTSESGFKAIDGSLNMVVAARDWELRVGELVLQVRDDEIKAVAGAEKGTTPWEIVTAPSLILAVGHEASVAIGRTIPFMTQRDDGSLVMASVGTQRDYGSGDAALAFVMQDEPFRGAVVQDHLFEGVHFSVMVDQANDEVVSIKELRLKISKLVGRVPIEGVPFDVGRPIMQNTEASMSLGLKPDQTAVIALPRDENGQPPIFMMLKARLIRP